VDASRDQPEARPGDDPLGPSAAYEPPAVDTLEGDLTLGPAEHPPISGATIGPWASAGFIAVVLALLAVVSSYSYLLFHTLAELFFAIVAVSIFVVAWVMRDYLDDDFPLFLGIALLATVVLRVVHTVDYAGVGIVESPDADQATQLWVAAGFVLSVSFLVAPLWAAKRMRLLLVVGVYGVVDVLVLLSVYRWKVFPTCYVPGSGLTDFKRISEYVICLVFAASFVTLYRYRERIRPPALHLLAAAYAVTIVAELLFTVYVGVYTWPLKVGHLLTVLAAYLVYKAVAEASLARPHALAVANLMLGEEAARAVGRRSEAVRAAFDELLELTPTFHVEAGYDEIATAVCRAARRMFKCQSAALFAVRGDEIVVESRDPRAQLMLPGLAFDISGDTELRRLVHSRETSFLADADEHPLLPAGVDRRVQKRAESALRVAIGAGPAADKVLILIWGEARRAPDPQLIALAQRFADQAGVALAQAGRHQAEIRAAAANRQLVANLVPSAEVVHPRVAVSTRYYATQEGLDLGGDFVGAVTLADGRLAVIVGDVAGHGPLAAALGATLRASWRALMLAGGGLRETVDILARVLAGEAHPESFVTFCAAIVDAERRCVEVVNIAHPQPLLLGAEVEALPAPPSPPLGFLDEPASTPAVFELPAGGWSLLLYSDGLIDARTAPGSSRRLDVEGLVGLLEEERTHGWDSGALDRVLATVELANGAAFEDDVAVLMVSSLERD
jgi:serine phosphatase RsbU (regulator of sigma subunit)